MYTEESGNEIKMYGTIWSGDGPYIASTLQKFAAKHTSGIVIRLHTPGGSVIDGNLIYNSINSLKTNVDVIIDGLAASMGTIIMLAGKKISIADNAYIMVHAPSGYGQGSAKDFESLSKLLRSMESNFVSKYVKKTTKPKEEVAKWLDGDNWFSADEALEAGLVDEVIGTVIEDLEIEAFRDMDLVALHNAFPSEKPTQAKMAIVPTNNKTSQNEMKLNAKNMTVLGLSPDASDEIVNAAIEALADRNAQLTAKIKADRDARVKAILDKAIAEGRLVATKREQMEALAEANMELFESTIEMLPAKADITSALEKGGAGKTVPEARESWNFDKWRKEDPKGLIEMKTNTPEAYAALLAAK
jgi:ATP-dependent Clp protease, protease subunit